MLPLGPFLARLRGCEAALEKRGLRTFPPISATARVLVQGFRLGVRGARWCQFGLVALWLAFRLYVYALMILPPVLRVHYVYYHDPRIRRRIRYGPAAREYLDVYVPAEAVAAQRGQAPRVPVVLAIMGGAFIIGHRGYNAQLGTRLLDFGVMTVGIDDRNFPRAVLPEMVQDISRGVQWVVENIGAHGGDIGNAMLVGQSAGAHLAASFLLERSMQEAAHAAGAGGLADVPPSCRGPEDGRGRFSTWSVQSLRGFVGVSGPYDLVKLGPHLASRGLHPRLVHHVAGGDLHGCSPGRVFETGAWRAVAGAAAARLPPVYLFHGGADKTIPAWSSSDFASGLRAAGAASVTLDIRPGMAHTYPVVEGPMLRHEPQIEVVLPLLLGQRAEELLGAPRPPPLWPPRVLEAAVHVCPF